MNDLPSEEAETRENIVDQEISNKEPNTPTIGQELLNFV